MNMPQYTYLRAIGIVLFIFILIKIDQQKLAVSVRNANIPLFIAALCTQYMVYISKTFRWHTMVRATAIQPTFKESWRLYHIGIFLATITPAKLGEFGKAAYLKQKGLSMTVGVILVIIDRLTDVFTIALIAIPSMGILFGAHWSVVIGALFVLGLIPLHFIWKRIPFALDGKTIALCLLYTVVSWVLYFSWAILIAYSVDINLPAHILIAAFTMTGILSLLPIAPAGLGTRDAALIALLLPYGIAPEQAVALAFLMFVSMVLSSTTGAYYWLKGRA